jgi:NAD+ kinase
VRCLSSSSSSSSSSSVPDKSDSGSDDMDASTSQQLDTGDIPANSLMHFRTMLDKRRKKLNKLKKRHHVALEEPAEVVRSRLDNLEPLQASSGGMQFEHTLFSTATQEALESPVVSKTEDSLPNKGEPRTIRTVAVLRKVSLMEQIQRGLLDEKRVRASIHDEKTRFAHYQNLSALGKVQEVLKSRGIAVRVVERLRNADVSWADAVVSVGGDGTFLSASHRIADEDFTPIIGVNSSPDSSYGYLCAADEDNFEDILEEFTSGQLVPFPLWRLRVFINGKNIPTVVLNDVLYAAENAAATSRYEIVARGVTQRHKSSGLWVATSAGSTAAIASAGGISQSLNDRRVQYRVRELFRGSIPPNEEPILGGFCDPTFKIVTRMSYGCIYVDGHREMIRLSFGDEITFKPSTTPLQWIQPAATQRMLRFDWEDVHHNLDSKNSK